MKVLIPILIGLLVVGCGKAEGPPDGVLGDDVGSGETLSGIYESEDDNNWVYRFVLKEDGSYQDYINGVALGDTGTWWKVVGKEVHISSPGLWAVYTLNADNDLVNIAEISNSLRDKGTREDYPKNKQKVFKRIKAETQPKTFKALKEEDVVGAYAQKYKDEGGAEIMGKLIFLKNGVAKNFIDDKTGRIVKWKIDSSEIRTIRTDKWTGYIYKKDKNGDLSEVGAYQGGHIIPYTIKERTTYKKIKSEKETSSKGDDKNSTTTKPSKELTLKEKVVGTYKLKLEGGTAQMVILENGKIEFYENGKKNQEEARLKMAGNEIHFDSEGGDVRVFRIELNGDLTYIAEIERGERYNHAKDMQKTFIKIK